MRNDLTIYDTVADHWWSDDIRWVRTLKNLVPGRLSWFDNHINWQNKNILDLGCAGGFMALALAERGAHVTGIDPAVMAIHAEVNQSQKCGLLIQFDVGVGEDLPYVHHQFDAVICVDVLEHVNDLQKVLHQVFRVLRPGGIFLYDTINRNIISQFTTITIAEDLLRLLPQGTHDPTKYIKPFELARAMTEAGLFPGPITGLGPISVNSRLDFTFGPVPITTILYMGIAYKVID